MYLDNLKQLLVQMVNSFSMEGERLFMYGFRVWVQQLKEQEEISTVHVHYLIISQHACTCMPESHVLIKLSGNMWKHISFHVNFGLPSWVARGEKKQSRKPQHKLAISTN